MLIQNFNGCNVNGRQLIVRIFEDLSLRRDEAHSSRSSSRQALQCENGDSRENYSANKRVSGEESSYNSCNYEAAFQNSEDYFESGNDCYEEKDGYSAEYCSSGLKSDQKAGFATRSECSSDFSEREYTFLSAANFPYKTSEGDIYNLFSEYDPRKVFMICNYPDPENITEAIVVFSNVDDAADAIFNLDNIMYRRRILLVTDANDSDIVPELLAFFDK